MAFPTKLPNIPTKATLSKGSDLNELFRPASRTVKNVAGQGRVPAPRIQILIEELRKNPNGVHNQFINMDMQAQSNLLQELGEAFPPARPDQFISPTGQEIVNFLQTGEGIDSSPQRMEILTRDYFDGMREGKVKGNQQTFPTEDAGDVAVDYDDPVTSGILPGQEGAKVEDISLANRPPRYAQAHRDAVERLGWRDRLDSQNSRPIKRRVDVFDDQPISTAMPEDKGNNISTSEVRERANTDGAKWDIYENRGTQDPYSSASDFRVAADSKSFQDSVDDWLNSLLHNSSNPESMGANNGNIDDLIALVANKKQPINRNPDRLTANSEKDLRLFFDSPDAAADALTSYFSPKMLLEMSDSTPIGSPQLPGSVRAKASLDDVQQMIKRKLLNRFSEKGWGAKSSEDLSNPAVLDPLDNVNDVELNDVELEDIDPADIKFATATDDLPNMFTRGRDGAARAARTADKKDVVLQNVEVMEELAADIRRDGELNGLTEDQIRQDLIDNNVGPADIQNYLADNITLIDDFGSVEGRAPGTNPLGGKVKKRNKKMNVKRDGESLNQKQKDGIREEIEKAKREQEGETYGPESPPVKEEPNPDGDGLDNSDGSGTEDIGDGLEGSEGTPIGDEFDPLTYADENPKGSRPKADNPQDTKPVDEKPADQSPPKGQDEKPADTNQKPPPKDPPPPKGGNDGDVTPAPKKPGIIRKTAGYVGAAGVAGGGLLALLAMMNRNGSKSVPPVDGMGGGNGGGNGGGGGALPPVPVRGGPNNRRMTPEEKAMLMRQLAQNSDRFNHNTQNMKSWVR